jgi:putative transcriptional regulator
MRRWTYKQNQEPPKHDPDNRPLSAADLKRMKRTPRVKIIRRALGLSQEEFSERYQIPIGTLRDWEQGRSVPDQPARAYLKVIARAPEAARKALNFPYQDSSGFGERSRRFTVSKRKRTKKS